MVHSRPSTVMQALRRLALALPLLALAPQAFAAPPSLRGEAQVRRDVITLGDLIDNAPAALSDMAVFRAPALGETGTIQAARIIETARGLGLTQVETSGLRQVLVSRPARRIATDEIETAVKAVLAQRFGLDGAHMMLVFDGAPPSMILPPDLSAPLKAEDVVYDPRARRVAANVAVGQPGHAGRRSLRVAAAIVETADVVVLTRPLQRGDEISPGDVALERRPREGVPADALAELKGSIGRATRRALSPGLPLRAGDITRIEVVARGELVTVVYQMPGMTLTVRGKTLEGGGLGDTIGIQNPQSKRVLQGVVSGPGTVTVSQVNPGPVAANTRN
jgi:flagella basal body P-ring formation protein FlgA